MSPQKRYFSIYILICAPKMCNRKVNNSINNLVKKKKLGYGLFLCSAVGGGLVLIVREKGKGIREKGRGKTNLYLSYGTSPRPSSLFPKPAYIPRRRRRIPTLRELWLGIKLEEMYLLSIHFLFVFVKIYGCSCRGGACSSRNRIAAR